MKQWEYTTESFYHLDHLGRNGWELVQVLPKTDTNGQRVGVFKRPIEEDEQENPSD